MAQVGQLLTEPFSNAEYDRRITLLEHKLEAAVRPGMCAHEPFDLFRDCVADLASSRNPTYRFNRTMIGHGIGSDGHESPLMRDGDATLLREGMVVTLEPMIFAEGIGGGGVEDMVLITSGGCESLTRSKRVWNA